MMTNNETRIAKASKVMGRALAKLAKDDPEMARALSDALAAEVERLRKG